jgi:hypothetical protein
MRITRIAFIGMMTLVICTTGCADQPEEKAKEHGQEIWFEEKIHDYGEIEQDSDGTWSFAFKNLGEAAFVINRVRSTCGCTVVDWPKEPFEPGTTGEITVKYNTATTGTFMKSVIVYSTAANSPVKLQIRGKVVAGIAEEE